MSNYSIMHRVPIALCMIAAQAEVTDLAGAQPAAHFGDQQTNGIAGNPVESGKEPARIAIPSAEARRASLARVQEIFADDYAGAYSPAKKSECAKRLVDQASQTHDPADRWTLLNEALRMATDCGDVATALSIIARITAEYQVDRYASRLEALTPLGGKAAGQAVDELVNAILELARDADNADEEEVASKASALASSLARKSKNEGLIADAARLQQKIRERRKVAKELAPLLEKVAASPGDPAANLEAGRALCFKADRWDEGLRLLARGSDAALARLASAELANPTTPADVIKLADGWWDWADGQKTPWKLPAQIRAAMTYGRVVNELQGLDKARVEKRISTVAAAGGGTGQSMFLADLKEVEVRDPLDDQCFVKDGTLYGKPFAVKGKHFVKAIMALPKANASSGVVFRLPAGAVRLRGHVGICTPAHAKPGDQPASPMTFAIVADDTVLWTSPPLKKRDETALFDVAIRNASKLELRTTATGHNANAWGAWLDPVIVK